MSAYRTRPVLDKSFRVTHKQEEVPPSASYRAGSAPPGITPRWPWMTPAADRCRRYERAKRAAAAVQGRSFSVHLSVRPSVGQVLRESILAEKEEGASSGHSCTYLVPFVAPIAGTRLSSRLSHAPQSRGCRRYCVILFACDRVAIMWKSI